MEDENHTCSHTLTKRHTTGHTSTDTQRHSHTTTHTKFGNSHTHKHPHNHTQTKTRHTHRQTVRQNHTQTNTETLNLTHSHKAWGHIDKNTPRQPARPPKTILSHTLTQYHRPRLTLRQKHSPIHTLRYTHTERKDLFWYTRSIFVRRSSRFMRLILLKTLHAGIMITI